MKKIVIIFDLLILLSLNVKAQDCLGTNKQEKKVLRLIVSLPEVRKENDFRRGAHYLTFFKAYIQNVPTATDNYYYVSISEEKGGRLFTYDWYKVNKYTYVICYYNVFNNNTISLKEWRIHKNIIPKHKVLSP